MLSISAIMHLISPMPRFFTLRADPTGRGLPRSFTPRPASLRRILLVTGVSVLILAAGHRTVTAQSPDDLSQIKQQVLAFHARITAIEPNQYVDAPVTDAQLQAWIQQMNADGSWPDLDYQTQRASDWPAFEHLRRLSFLTGAFAKTKLEGHPDPVLLGALTKALDFWLFHGPTSKAWWYQQVGAPNALTDAMLVIEDTLTDDEKRRGLELTDQPVAAASGENLVWWAMITFKRALLMNDVALAWKQRAIILGELRPTLAEGLQFDNSFHQHGPQPQLGNYGLSFATSLSSLAWFCRGTSFALDEGKLAILRDYLLRGEAVIVANKAVDVSACGRQLTPHSTYLKGYAITAVLGLMEDIDPDHAADYRTAVAQASAAVGCGDPTLPGSRLDVSFYRSDYVVHRRPEFFASVKLASRRVQGEEDTNGENILSRYLADGVLLVYQDSLEYADLYPLWDWRRLPGVTCPSQGPTLAPQSRMASDFSGEVSDGTYGAVGLDYNRDGVTGHKSWFLFDHEIFCLGAGLTYTGDGTLITGIEQCWHRGEVWAGAANDPGSLQGGGQQSLNGTAWVWHHGIAYLLPGSPGAILNIGSQNGAWKKISLAASSTPMSGDVFSLWIDHGPQPASASYAYAVLPGCTREQASAAAASCADAILSNTPDVAAVTDRSVKLTLAVFYHPGQITCDQGPLQVDAPCALILDGSVTPPRLTVADPSQLGRQVNVTLAGKTVQVDLPQGAQAGESVPVNLN